MSHTTGSSPLRLGVFGDPVAHSLSPRIHRQFAELAGLAVDYQAYPVSAAELGSALQQFAAARGQGLNLTVPHKQAVLAFCHSLSTRAQIAGAVNTLVRLSEAADTDECRWHGDNTDGLGLRWDLTENLAWCLGGRPLVIVGIGGAAAGILPSLLEIPQPWSRVILANRDIAKLHGWWSRHQTRLQELARCPLELCALAQLEIPDQALLINATACGHQGICPQLPLPQGGGQAYDLNYGRAAQPFLHWAAQQSAWQGRDGLGMLVGQAAAAFKLWTGIAPDAATVLRDLRLSLSAGQAV